MAFVRAKSIVRRRQYGWCCLVLTGVVLCADSSSRTLHADTALRLTNVTAKTGISFIHTDGSRGGYHIVETTSAGIALFDYDQDGDLDVYFLNGAPMPDAAGETLPPDESRPTNALYRNDGQWQFTDVTVAAGVGDPGHGMGIAVADYNGDGFPDLYLNNGGPNVLYRNNGDGTFENVTAAAGVANGNRIGAGAAFVDVDNDGDLDLYVANYVIYEPTIHEIRTQNGIPVYKSPLDYPPDADTLYRNNGDGTFADVSKESGIAVAPAYGMGIVCSDFDTDGDSDIFVGNDTGANYLFVNNGAGVFEENALLSGFAFDGSGAMQGTMGVDCGDVDNDGDMDLHVTSYQNEHAVLYVNEGEFFVDDSRRTGASLGTTLPVTWGNALADFDNDGDRDVFMACGHLHDRVEEFDNRATYETRNILLENLGNCFTNVSDQCGSGLKVKLSSRGAAVGDLDGDGDLDVVVLNSRDRPTLLRNDSPSSNRWLDIRLRADGMNSQAVGARVEVVAGDLRQWDEVRSGRSYQSHFGTELHFGLGDLNRVDIVRVHWPPDKNGVRSTQELTDVAVDRVLTISKRVK